MPKYHKHLILGFFFIVLGFLLFFLPLVPGVAFVALGLQLMGVRLFWWRHQTKESVTAKNTPQ